MFQTRKSKQTNTPNMLLANNVPGDPATGSIKAGISLDFTRIHQRTKKLYQILVGQFFFSFERMLLVNHDLNTSYDFSSVIESFTVANAFQP